MATARLWYGRRANGTRRWIGWALAVIVVFGVSGVVGERVWIGQRLQQQRAAVGAPPSNGVTQIDMRDSIFAIPHVRVQAGSTLTWLNADAEEHDVVLLDGSARSSMLMQHQTWSHTFATPGSYDYVCSQHAFMIGKVTVTE